MLEFFFTIYHKLGTCSYMYTHVYVYLVNLVVLTALDLYKICNACPYLWPNYLTRQDTNICVSFYLLNINWETAVVRYLFNFWYEMSFLVRYVTLLLNV